MEFSSIAFCAKDKMAVDFRAYPLLSGALIHQSSSMGIHKSGESPFVELTAHKPHVHSSFKVANLNGAKQFLLTEKVHSFTCNTRNFVRGETFLQQKEIYSHKFPMMALSQLVGGFVGSKSQLGSCGRESFQIWDIIFDKLAEFCRAQQSASCSLYASEGPGNCYNIGNNFSQDIFGSFCQESVSTFDGSHIIIENSVNPLRDKVIDTLSQSSTVPGNCVPVFEKPSSLMSSSTQNGNKVCPTSHVSRMSYAEVAKAFAIAQQSKQHCTRASTMKKRRNTPHHGDMKNSLRHLSWKYCNEPSVKNYGNDHILAISCRKTPHCSKVVSMYKVGKGKTNKTFINVSESNSKKNMNEVKSNSQRTVSKEVYQDCSQVCDKSSLSEDSNCMSSMEDKSGKPCATLSCSSSGGGEVDDSPSFTNRAEDGSKSAVINASGIVLISPSNLEHHQPSVESPARERCLSDCSTDSDDSFVSFERGVDCSGVTAALASESDPSEDGVGDQSSGDDDDDDDDDDCDNYNDDENDDSNDTETVSRLKEVNARWRTDYAEYLGCEKNPIKVHFACDTALETVHPLITWNYAYRAARCGPWVRMAGDRERFMARIRRMEPVLAVVLSGEHRHHIWSKRMAGESPRPL